MNKFTIQNTMNDVFSHADILPYARYMMYENPYEETDPNEKHPDAGAFPISGMAEIGWSPEGIVNGLNFLLERIEKQAVTLLPVYEEAACSDPQMKEVNLIRIVPEHIDLSKPAVILAAGGGYHVVCTMVESLPTARHFVTAGYQVFLLTYRVGEDAVTPKAIADLAAAIHYLGEHEETLQADISNLVIGGYSAGANLISNWGVPGIGYKKYNLPMPKALLPVYTFIDLKTEAQRDGKGGLLPDMFGADYKEYLEEYHIAGHIDGDYPPCYIVCGKDDATVPCRNSELLKELLDAAGVAAILDEGEHAPHGFGDGTGTDVEGWPERAMEFIQGL